MQPTIYLPDDFDAARPEDLRRRQRRPRAPATPLLLGEAARAWPLEDPKAGAFHYIGQALTPEEFREYCLAYYFGAARPSYWIWHHTYQPDASWAPVSKNPATWWDRNEAGMTIEQKKAKRKPQVDAIMRYYRDTKGWTVGPHIFIDDLFFWLFTPMYYVGIHANEGNSYKKGGKTRYSIGCEVVGFYDHVAWPATIRAMCGWGSACVKAALQYENIYTAAGQDRPDIHDLQLSGHRDYTTEKTCPGAKITSDFYVAAARDGWSAYQANTPPGPNPPKPVPPPDPLKVKQIAGANGTQFWCGVGFYDYYMMKVGSRDGVWELGLPQEDEQPATDQDKKSCTKMRFERGWLKYRDGEGVRPALIEEARQLQW